MTLPIPSSIPRCDRPELAAAERQRFVNGGQSTLVGHFGTYGTHVAPMIRTAAIALLAADTTVSMVCTGGGSERFVAGLIAERPELRACLHATGRVPSAAAAAVLSACDLVLQPFPDGVTTRRTSVMAALSNGRPVLTTTGHLTEAGVDGNRRRGHDPGGRRAGIRRGCPRAPVHARRAPGARGAR